jgi:hypothetical protein
MTRDFIETEAGEKLLECSKQNVKNIRRSYMLGSYNPSLS